MRLGIDVGATAIKSGLVDDEGHVYFPETTPTHTEEGKEAVLRGLIDVCLRQLKNRPVTSIGLGLPGRVDTRRGILVSSTNLRLSDVPLTQILQEALKLPVFADNDANCALYGEISVGGSQDAENLLLVTIGTGIGGSIRIGGRIHSGIDNRAGEFGHMTIAFDGRPCPCGRSGCWEQYASATALCRFASEAVQANPTSLLAEISQETGGVMTGKTVFSALLAGCPTADAVLSSFADFLTAGLNNLTIIFRPDRIVLSGGVFQAEAGELLLSRIQERCLEPARLFRSTLQGQAGLIGASLLEKFLPPVLSPSTVLTTGN